MRPPRGATIRLGRRTARLYRLESKADRLVRAIARELTRILELRDERNEGLPEALLALLERPAHSGAAIEAARALLEREGYHVSPSPELRRRRIQAHEGGA